MTEDIKKQLSEQYCPRFGQLAVEFGFITREQLIDALTCQVDDELNGRKRRLLGQILLEMESMSASQVDHVITKLFKQMRQEQHGVEDSLEPL